MFQMHKNKFCVMAVLFAILIGGVSATTQQDKQPKRNLKVLPKNTTHEELDKVMKEFNVSLGVKCNHCHAPSKIDPKKLDFASDEKPEKEITRNMMKLTAGINKKYFKAGLQAEVASITCITCHNGKKQPENDIPLPPPRN